MNGCKGKDGEKRKDLNGKNESNVKERGWRNRIESRARVSKKQPKEINWEAEGL